MAASAQPMAARNPVGWAWNADSHCPRTAWANAVVMPQVGQGTPHSVGTLHGGAPKAMWVPMPVGLGVSDRATASTPAHARKTPTPHRRTVDARSARGATKL